MDAAEPLARTRSTGRTLLVETEAKALLEQWGIPTTLGTVATSRTKAAQQAAAIGFPVVLKILSPDIVHKTEVGGVRVGLGTKTAVRSAYDEIIANASQCASSADIWGVNVQPMVSGIEVIIGAKRDPLFGPIILFGMGGILVELMQDAATRLVPIRPDDAADMLHEVRGFPLLAGYRGRGADVESLKEMLLKVSSLMEARTEIAEIDLNPVMASSEGSVVADARIRLEGAEEAGRG